MNNPQNFLITYGLHNFVTHAQGKKKHVFFVGNKEGQKMANHAMNLIRGSFGDSADIQMV